MGAQVAASQIKHHNYELSGTNVSKGNFRCHIQSLVPTHKHEMQMAGRTMVLEQPHTFVNAGEKRKTIRLSPRYTTHTVPHFPVPYGAQSPSLSPQLDVCSTSSSSFSSTLI